MCTKTVSYKAYQQVLDLAGDNKRTSKLGRQASPATPRKRTKSGCLTCRRRKKKCDEEKIGGKCQACVRNFLDCCWPGEPAKVEEVTKPEPVEQLATPNKGASAYPSPVSSPKAEAVEGCKDIKPLVLSELKFKVTKATKQYKKAPSKKAAQTHFIVTSFDLDSALCQVKV